MTSPSLTLGSVLLAFSPVASLLFVLVIHKPLLLILAVCSAFAYLLSSLLASLLWLVTAAIGGAIGDASAGAAGSDLGTLFALAIPGVACQMAARCAFVGGYFRVEEVIRGSVAKHEAETAAATPAHGGAADPHAETNSLQLQLNDLSGSVASGCGYALFHALLLYGTLLASESGESNSYNEGAYAGGGGSTGHGGTLYQQSCGGMPSLINGALIACMFSVLDVMWMVLCFFGMRRRAQNNAGTSSNATAISSGGGPSTAHSLLRGLACLGLTDTRSGGTAALLVVAVTHLAAALVLAPNGREDGCQLSLPLLGGVVLWVGAVLRQVATKTHLLPEDQRRRIQELQLGLRRVDQDHHVE